jgi:hypothetical protein
MPGLPVKREYRPTLGDLLAPRWRAARPATRRSLIAVGVGLAALTLAVVLTLLNPVYSHGGRVPFSFPYRGLYRTAAEPGGYVRVEKRSPSGRLLYSFAVDPLELPPYRGELTAELPIFASTYIRALEHRDPGAVIRGEGKTRVNSVPAYDILYTAPIEGRQMYGRDVLLLPQRRGVREGVSIVMLTAEDATKQVDGPMEVATTGLLFGPLRGFQIG